MLRGFLFGLTVAAAIGPIALLIINTSVRFGLAAGVRSALGAAAADFVYAVAATFAGGALVQLIANAAAEIRLFASVALMAMGAWIVYAALRNARRGARSLAENPRAFVTTLALTIVNPMTMLAFAAFIAQAPAAVTPEGAALTVIGIVAGSLAAQLALALGGVWARPLFASGPAMLTLNLLSGAGIFAFGLAGLVLN